jgi:CheY-like chemotaxis protein
LAVTACLNKPITAERLLHEIERLEGVQDVLVVDDDRAFCRLVERMLKASGRIFSVRQAYDGQDGLRALRGRRPDLLLLDLMMPGVDGFHVLKEMRQDAKLVDLPVILLTAISLAEDALMQRRGQVVIRRSDGLSPVEALRCLGAVVDVLEARYDEKSVPQEALV